jgi:hypothetical protein
VGLCPGREPFAEVWLLDAGGLRQARPQAGLAPVIVFGRGARYDIVVNRAPHVSFWPARSPRR